MASPTAVVTGIADIQDDPSNPGVNAVVTIVARLLFMGPLPLEQQISVVLPNSFTKTQSQTVVNNAVIAAAAELGYALTTDRVLTIKDLA